MIYPKNNWLFHWIVDVYIKFIIKRHFHEIVFDPIVINPKQSVLLISNHFSVWDGLLLYWLNGKLLKKNFHAMMLEETLKREPMLKYGGCFSINKGSRDILQSLKYAAVLLKNPQNLVTMFPQGKLYSNFVNKVQFEKGIMRIIKQADTNFAVVFAAIFVESFKNKKNSAFIYLSDINDSSFRTIEELTQAYQQHYDISKTRQTAIII